jgi:hypothetical protein
MSRLFDLYINLFLKIQQKASGRPSWAQTEADLDRYMQMNEAWEGIHLDLGKVTYSAGLRSLAKLLLNNFWENSDSSRI